MADCKNNYNFIILSYLSIQKSIQIPLDFASLENEFLNLFGEDRNKEFAYYYLEKAVDKELKMNISYTNYEYVKKDLLTKDKPILFIECKNKGEDENNEGISISIEKSESEKEKSE